MLFKNGCRQNSLVSFMLLSMLDVTTQFSDLLMTSAASTNDGIHMHAPSFLDREDLSHHLRTLDETKLSQDILLKSPNDGYFYAEYYDKVNCSSGTGTVSYVEGYSTGVCLPLQTIAGVQSGSIVQTCNDGNNSIDGLYCFYTIIIGANSSHFLQYGIFEFTF